MAHNLMICGTMSSAGKSFIVTGLCRLFARMGYKVAPFKSQNMALNSGVTEDGDEMGRAQVVQAEAAGVKPDVRMNPVLLKPSTDVGSQVIVLGKSRGNMSARDYYAYKTVLIPEIMEAYESLAAENDIIVIEGAGSPAEINLKENDIVNMGLAKMLHAPVILVGDIDLGGVFAQLLGTLEWMDEEEKDMIAGLLINKFRGDPTLLTPGIEMLEERCGKKVLGVVPMVKAKIDEEDSITQAFATSKGSGVDIAVIRLPRISNFTDFSVFQVMDRVTLRYVYEPAELGTPDLIILPGTKSTISDLEYLKKTGLADAVRTLAGTVPICGICGGYQMLGTYISDPYEIEGGGETEGLGLLPTRTVMAKDKKTVQTEGVFEDLTGVFAALNGMAYRGYEIHQGVTETLPGESSGSEGASALSQDAAPEIFGTYVHGVFDREGIAETLVNALLTRKGAEKTETAGLDYDRFKAEQYDILADALEQALDLEGLKKIMGM